MSASVEKHTTRRRIEGDLELAVQGLPDIAGDDPGNHVKKKNPIKPERVTVRYWSNDDGVTWWANIMVYGPAGIGLMKGFAQYQGRLEDKPMPEWLRKLVREHLCR